MPCAINLLDEGDPFEAVKLLVDMSKLREEELSSHIHETYKKAKELSPEIEHFLLWFVEEQVEEVALFSSLIAQVKLSGGNVLLLDNSDFVRQLLTQTE